MIISVRLRSTTDVRLRNSPQPERARAPAAEAWTLDRRERSGRHAHALAFGSFRPLRTPARSLGSNWLLMPSVLV
jgi:hypothetical protein